MVQQELGVARPSVDQTIAALLFLAGNGQRHRDPQPLSGHVSFDGAEATPGDGNLRPRPDPEPWVFCDLHRLLGISTGANPVG